MGNVYEPYLALTVNFDILQDRLMSGLTLAEAAYAATRGISWMNVIVGDPLYRPYASWSSLDSDTRAPNLWQRYRKIVLAAGADPLAAADALRKLSIETKDSMPLEALAQAQADAGNINAALGTLAEAEKLEKKAPDSLSPRARAHRIPAPRRPRERRAARDLRRSGRFSRRRRSAYAGPARAHPEAPASGHAMSRTLAALYRDALASGGLEIREESGPFLATSELELQAQWFAGELGSECFSAAGEIVRIEDFGRWNREAGPDFADARVRVGQRELRGAIELDLDARDWERHGHATNPAFRDTVLHVFLHAPTERFFTRTCDHREVTQAQISPPDKPSAHPLPEAPLAHLAPQQMRALVEAAGRHRLDLKAAALRRYSDTHGEDEALFAALAVTLGYKRNQTPFLLLAQKVGLRGANEATLFGVAGFLEAPEPPAADREVRGYLRELWEDWWKLRAGCERWILPHSAWQLAGIRPANHPHRRVAAMAGLAKNWEAVREMLGVDREKLERTLECLAHPFWERRFNLQAAALKKPQALLGAERIRDIVINLHHPLAVARDESAWAAFLTERGPAPAAIMRVTARRLFGPAADARGFLGAACIQQGLLQIERDYRAAPEPEAFLAALRRWSESSTPADARQ